MAKTLPALEPVARVAARHSRLARGAVPGDSHAGLPVPVPGPDGMRIAILLAATERTPALATDAAAPASPGARRIQAPRYLVTARADTGDFIELAAITPGDLGVAQDPETWLGELADGDGTGAERARLLELLDTALPIYMTGRAAETPSAKSAARQIQKLWDEVAEAPLAPYYRALGKRFFEWIDRAAAP